jgi:hypothetical protein
VRPLFNQAVLHGRHVGAVTPGDACPPGNACPHCALGRPSAPVEAGDPRDLSMAVADVQAELRVGLPPAYHRPEWWTGGPWRCACCWNTAWPCPVAARHGTYVNRSLRMEFALARMHDLVMVAGEPNPVD